jgi:hypothetical protein
LAVNEIFTSSAGSTMVAPCLLTLPGDQILIGDTSVSMGIAVLLAGGSAIVQIDRHFYADSYIG